MFTKYKINIEGLEGYRFTADGDLYKMPFTRNKRSYDFRLIKIQNPNRWKIEGEWYSKRQLRPKLIEDDNPIEIYKVKEMPF